MFILIGCLLMAAGLVCEVGSIQIQFLKEVGRFNFEFKFCMVIALNRN